MKMRRYKFYLIVLIAVGLLIKWPYVFGPLIALFFLLGTPIVSTPVYGDEEDY